MKWDRNDGWQKKTHEQHRQHDDEIVCAQPIDSIASIFAFHIVVVFTIGCD